MNRLPLTLAVIAALAPTAALAAPAGRVDFAVGNVTAVAADGKSRPLAKGAEIQSGETIDTGSGRAQVRFTDGAQVSLQPQTQFRIDEYKYTGKGDEEEKGFFSLVKGGLRTITGLVGKKDRENYRVTTSVATIGIRGTEYVAALGDGLNVTTGEGSVEVCNAAGCLILNSGDSGFVPTTGAAPSRTETKTSLPPAAANNTTAPTLKTEINQAEKPLTKSTDLASGGGYALTASAYGDDAMYRHVSTSGATGQARFAADSKLTSYSSDTNSLSLAPGTTVGAFSDGILGWGAWTGGTVTVVSDGITNVFNSYYTHYVVGKPTAEADLLALQTNNMIGTYALAGYTLPTSSNGTIASAGSVSGTLSANFGTGDASGSLSVTMGGTYTSNWSGSISGAGFSGSGLMSGCGTNCALSVKGFFAGADAARAGMTYKIYDTDGLGNIHGAAVFKNTNMTKGADPEV